MSGDSALDKIIGIQNKVSDTTILTGLWISSVVGVAVTILFCILQRTSLLYKYRLVAGHVRVKPPELRQHGLISLIDWAIKSISVSDVAFVQSCGLDALIMVKICSLGVQIFLPLCILGVLVLIPLHWTGGVSSHLDADQSGFMRLTMSNIPQGSHVFWVHVVFVYIYLAWAMVLLRWHYMQYLTIRQYYLRKGDDVNLWRALYEQKEQPAASEGDGKFGNLMRSLKLIKAFMPSGVPVANSSDETPAKQSDDEEEDEVLGRIPSTRKRSLKDGLVGCRSASRAAADGFQRRHDVRRSEFVVRTGGPAAAKAGLARRSLPSATGSPFADVAAGPGRQAGSGGGGAGYSFRGRATARSAEAVSPMSPAPVAEATEGLQERAVGGLESASAVARALLPQALSHKEATAAPALPVNGSPTLHQPPQPVEEPRGTSEVRLHLKKSGAVGGVSRGSRGLDRVVVVGSGDLARAAASDPDLEAGLSPAAAPERCAADPPRTLPPDAAVAMSRGGLRTSPSPSGGPDALPPSRTEGTALDPDAHLLEWWQERREVEIPLGPVDTLREQLAQALGHGKAELPHAAGGGGVESGDGTAGGEGGGGGRGGGVLGVKVEVGVDLTRPSVGHRKTVNADYSGGKRVSVLAQHYAVLVTDVVERSAEEGARSGKASAQSQATTGEPTKESTASKSPPRRMASILPRWLRSWCNLQYGSLAARKLDPALRANPSGEVMSIDPLSGSSIHRTLHNNALATASNAQMYSARAGSDGRIARALSNRRVRSANEPLPISTLVQQSWSAGRAGNSAGSGGGLSPPAAVRQPASLSRGAPGNNGGGGDRLIRVLELLARDARRKLAAYGMESSASVSASTAAAAAAVVVTAADAAGMAHDSSSTGRAGAAAGDSPRAVSAASAPASARLPEGARPLFGGRQVASAAAPLLLASEGVPGRHQHVAAAGAGPVAEASEVREAVVGGAVRDGSAAVTGGDGGGGASAAAPAVKQPLQDASDAAVQISGGASVRRRRGAAAATAPDGTNLHANGAAAAAADDGGAAADDAGAAEQDGSDVFGAAATVAATVTAADRWAFLRMAVWNGDVAALPWRYRYSVVSATFLRLFPDEFDRAIPVINFKEVDMLLMRVDQHMAQYEYAVQYEEETGKQLFSRIGCCGLTGERRRMREYHREEINRLLVEVREARRRAFDTAHTPSWFVFFRTQRAAAIASQCIIHAEDNRQFRVHPAPGPDEVNWSTLWSNFRSRDLRRNLMRPLVFLVVLFPIGIFTGALTQLDYLLCPSHVCVNLGHGSNAWTNAGCTDEIYRRESQQLTWDWYCDQKDPIAKLLKRLVVAWLPSLLLVLWQGMVLPLVFTFVVQIGREARSLSEADRCIAKNMFYFAVFNVFLGGVAGSTIFQGINSAIEKGPSEIFNLIGTYVPTSSNFFINYTMFRAFVAVPLRMLWPHIGIRMYLLRRYLRVSCIITRRERAFLMAPVSPRYGFEVGMIMIIFLVGFAFSVVSPLLLPMALLFFIISWVFWRWALLYVYVRKYEGGGTMWPFTFNRVMVCMAIFPVFTACVFITKHAYVQAIFLLVTFPVVLIRFNKYCYYRFETGLQALPLEATVLAPHARVDPWVYTPPPLLSNLAGWHPDWSKSWMGWNLPVVFG